MANINKNKKYHFIYKTTNLINGDFYIGMHSTSNLNDGYLGSGKRLRYSIRKHGIVNFKCEILEFLPDRESLIKREIELVNEDLLKEEKCINLKPGGQGGFMSETHAYNFHVAGRKALTKKINNNPDFKKKYCENISNNAKKNIKNLLSSRYDWSGKKHSEKSKEKMSQKASKRVGEKNSQFDTCWITKDKVNLKIKKVDIDNYLNSGWIKGRYVETNKQ